MHSAWSEVGHIFREGFRKETFGLLSERKDIRPTGIKKPRNGDMETPWRVQGVAQGGRNRLQKQVENP